MLKGHVFSRQLFENQMFALFINTFLNGANGISDNYKNGMAVTYSGSNVTVDSGAVCVQGRFVEEDTSTTISAGTENMYCKLVIEIDLDQQNTESELNQVSYKIIKSANSYPALTQSNIVKNNAGVYQYELARFKTSANGISEFQDMRTFLDFESIYTEISTSTATLLDTIQGNANTLINNLENEIAGVEDTSEFIMKSQVKTLSSSITTTQVAGGYQYSASFPLPAGFTFNNTTILEVSEVQGSGFGYFRALRNYANVTVSDTVININYVVSTPPESEYDEIRIKIIRV